MTRQGKAEEESDSRMTIKKKIEAKIKQLESINQSGDFDDHIQMLEELLE